MKPERQLALVSLLVNDYDEAIAFYTGKLGFTLTEDTRLSDHKRWVTVSADGQNKRSASILLAKAQGDRQRRFVGDQSGGRVFLFLHTDNFERDYQLYLANGVRFVRPPVIEPYGTVAVFADLYGNLWDLIEPAAESDS